MKWSDNFSWKINRRYEWTKLFLAGNRWNATVRISQRLFICVKCSCVFFLMYESQQQSISVSQNWWSFEYQAEFEILVRWYGSKHDHVIRQHNSNQMNWNANDYAFTHSTHIRQRTNGMSAFITAVWISLVYFGINILLFFFLVCSCSCGLMIDKRK